MKMKLLVLTILIAASGTTSLSLGSRRASNLCALTSTRRQSQNGGGTSDRDENRRSMLVALMSGIACVIARPEGAVAKDEVFKTNPLTNPVLEQIRIWDQDFANEVKYSGELAPAGAGNKGKVEAYPRLLIPIVEISNDISRVNELIKNRDSWKEAQTILSQSKYEKIKFKKIFNAYGDNIYYSDPDRANAYLGGGATPKNEQSMAYLLRNDILTNIESLQAELDYLLKPDTPVSEKEQPDDLLAYARTAKSAMEEYLTLVSPNDMKKTLELMAQST